MADVGLCPLPDWKVPKWNPVWIPGTECLLQVLPLDHASWKGLHVPWRLVKSWMKEVHVRGGQRRIVSFLCTPANLEIDYYPHPEVLQ
jgi:hypothetical protein